jgi:hypothetical protein
MYTGVTLHPERWSASGHGKLPSIAPLSTWLVGRCYIFSPKCRALASALSPLPREEGVIRALLIPEKVP